MIADMGFTITRGAEAAEPMPLPDDRPTLAGIRRRGAGRSP
jgi:hypothetical protein